jgi:rare lipoprotein A
MSCLFAARRWRFFVARLWLFAVLVGGAGWASANADVPATPAAADSDTATDTATAIGTATVADVTADTAADAPSLGLKPPAQGALTLPSQLTAPPVLSKRKIKAERLPQVDLQFPQEYGLASWYGAKHHNKRTASGERFDMHDFTAAHPTLPFGSRVCVRSALTGREVVVRINDRGGFAGKRVIDISRAAAEALGMTHLGTNRVSLHTLPDEDSTCPGTEAEDDADDTAED